MKVNTNKLEHRMYFRLPIKKYTEFHKTEIKSFLHMLFAEKEHFFG